MTTGQHAYVREARLAVDLSQRDPLRLRLLQRLLPRQLRPRKHRCRPPRRLLPLRRPCDAQRGLLGGGKGAQGHCPASVLHLRLVGLGPTEQHGHTRVAGLVVGLS
eukprot:scaffold128821_cov72-Phaeocystis_antarctica.AAC.2